MRQFSDPLHLKRAGPQGTFTALASTYQLDRQGDRVLPGAFRRTLERLAASGGRIPLLWNHDQRDPIGAIADARETADGLEVDGQLALALPRASEAQALLEAGALSCSIGFSIAPGGADISGPVRLISDIDLHEISLVAVPANAGAVVRDVKALYPTPRDLERALREALHLSGREAKRLVAGGWQAMATGADAAPPNADEPIDPNTEARILRALERTRSIFQ